MVTSLGSEAWWADFVSVVIYNSVVIVINLK
jgi:hypothetical protein